MVFLKWNNVPQQCCPDAIRIAIINLYVGRKIDMKNNLQLNQLRFDTKYESDK